MKKVRNKPRRYRVFAGDRLTTNGRLFFCMVRMMAACDSDERTSEEASKQNQRDAEAA
jgi:hypothetical protein